jgi:hypothetical protein
MNPNYLVLLNVVFNDVKIPVDTFFRFHLKQLDQLRFLVENRSRPFIFSIHL